MAEQNIKHMVRNRQLTINSNAHFNILTGELRPLPQIPEHSKYNNALAEPIL
jgi:hypothetical protein